jgi:transcriptional regulator with XRE-family HTH domain
MKPKTLFGDFFKSKRIERGFTLREFCKTYDLDPGNISKMERGLLEPPNSREKLEEYANYLRLKKGSSDWYELFDKAAACKGKIPEEFLDNTEIINSLPIIFRTFRSKKISKEVVKDLIEKIKQV